jgi:D-alanyl-D-alanine carboxypeptidase
LQLVDEAKLSLDDPLSRFFPDWPRPGAQATVRQLLNHTSGLFDYSKIPGFLGSEEAKRLHSTAELIALMRGRPAKAAPGAEWEYNNGGYVLLGAIVEQVTGRPWSDEVQRRIARPLGLTSLTDAVAADANPATARFYGKDDDSFVPANGAHMSMAGAAGNLAMSIADMAKWAHALHHGQVVSEALYADMTRPAVLADGTTRPYGFGLRLQRLLGKPVFSHGGAARGVDTDSIYLPDEDLFVAVFANSDRLPIDASTVSQRLAAAALGRPFPFFTPTQVPESATAALLGTYQPSDRPPLRLFSHDGTLRLGRGDDEHELIAAGGDRFYFGADNLVWLEFDRTAGEVPVMIVHRPEAGEPLRATRTGDAPPPFAVPAEVLRGYVSTYKTEVPVLTVALDDRGRLTIAAGDGVPMVMRPVTQTDFRVEGGGFAVTFHPEGGKTDRLTLKRGARTLNGIRQE